jgi:predicted dienelactone hydrolase
VQDVPAVLNQLNAWNQNAGHALNGRLDLSRVGMSGHSFGAMTTQAVGGQSFEIGGQRLSDPRIRAALALSPSAPRRGGDPAEAFRSVQIPWMLMTGTKDTAPIGEADADSRLKVYPHLPRTIDKYELVLHNAEHSAFTERALPGESEARNPNHHRVILACSTAFWDAYLREDPAARTWLATLAEHQILEPEDRWQVHQPDGTPGEPTR